MAMPSSSFCEFCNLAAISLSIFLPDVWLGAGESPTKASSNAAATTMTYFMAVSWLRIADLVQARQIAHQSIPTKKLQHIIVLPVRIPPGGNAPCQLRTADGHRSTAPDRVISMVSRLHQ